jgi:hypothetical protein
VEYVRHMDLQYSAYSLYRRQSFQTVFLYADQFINFIITRCISSYQACNYGPMYNREEKHGTYIIKLTKFYGNYYTMMD